MKKILLLFSYAIMLTSISKAQCTQLMYPAPGFVKITSSQSLAATGTGYWICDGLTVTVTSSPGSAYYCESNVTLIIQSSSGDQVFAKPGCTVINNSSTSIGVTCDTATVTLTNNGSGNIVLTAQCTPLTYDYSLVGGSSGCATGIQDYDESTFKIYPNPASDILNFTEPVYGGIMIFDVSGREVLSIMDNGISSININALLPGTYVIRIQNRNYTFIK